MSCMTPCGGACMAHPWQMACITFVKNMGADTIGKSNTPNYLGGHLPQTGHVEEGDDNRLD